MMNIFRDKLMMKYSFIVAVLCLCSVPLFAQTPTYNVILKNDTLLNTTTYQFEIYLQQTGTDALELATLQSILTFNTGISSGSLTYTIVAGSSQLDPSQQPTNAKLSISGNELRIAANSPPGAGSGTIIPVAPGLRVGTFRIASSTPFATQTADLTWKNSGNPFTKVNAYVAATSTNITDSTGHLSSLHNPTLSPLIITSTSPLSLATAGTAYNNNLQASGGTPPYSWSVISGSLPSGLTLSSGGLISGTTTVAGVYSVTIQSTDSALITASKAFSLTVKADTATHLVFVQGPTTAPSGTAITPPVTVQMKDAFDNDVTSAGTTIGIALTTGSGTLSGTTLRFTNSGGLATFNDLSINLSGSKNLTASTAGLTSVVSTPFTITAGAATQVVFIQQPTSDTAGNTLSPSVTVRLRDAAGNNVSTSGVSITVSLLGTGTLSGTITKLTSGTGVSTFNNLSIDLAGSKKLRAVSGSLTPDTSNSFTISAAAADHLVFQQQPTPTTAGAVISPPVTVQLRDPFENDVPLSGDSVSMTLNGTGILSGTTTKATTSSGLASFNNLVISQSGSKTLTASVSGLTPATSVPFAVSTFIITATSEATGTISPSGSVPVNSGGNQSFIITPNTGYHIDSVVVDGANQGAITNYLFSNVTANHTISSFFSIDVKTITASAGTNGSISPSGSVQVNYGANQSFTITPNSGYHIDSVKVDGVNQGPITTYLFSNVTINHTIASFFSINIYTITATAGTNGTMTPSGSVQVNHGTNQSFTITANSGYHIDSVVVDGANQGAITSYLFSNVTTNHTISSYYSINTFTITATAGANGSITPSGSVQVTQGASQSFTITPSLGYHVSDVVVDGVSAGAVTSYNFPNVTANHTITASFTLLGYTITATAGANGTITPSGSVPATFGSSQAFTITANTGYHIDSVKVDGINQGAIATYTFSNITANHTITSFYSINVYTITTTAGANGTITPSGSVQVNYGASQSFTIASNTGYHIDSVIVDGINQGAITNYQFSTVTANHTITSFYSINVYTITATAGINGSITPSGSVLVNHGASQSFTIAPNTGYHIDSVKVDGVSVGAVASYNFPSVTTNHTITASFVINGFTITATAGANGSISPSGSVGVTFGASQLFTMTPNTGYHVSDVVVDGSSVGAVTSYNFPNVAANHTIVASFAPNTLSINIQTVPSGQQIVIDNVTFTSPHTFNWTAATSHTVNVIDTVNGGAAIRYVWSSWSDTGAKLHSVSPLVNTTFTANFTTQYFLTMNANVGGTVTPPNGWYSSGTNVPITAFPGSKYSFNQWSGNGSGSYSGFTNPSSVTMNAPITEIASFQRLPIQITIQANPPGRFFVYDGSTYNTPQTRTVNPGEIHSVDIFNLTQPSIPQVKQFVWSNWSDGGAKFHDITPDTNTTYTANFTTQFFLTTAAGSGGTVSPASAWQDSGKVDTLTATPNTGYSFLGWKGIGSGSYTGPANPTTIIMNAAINDTATFTLFPVHATIQSNPPGRSILVDGVTFSSPQTFTWTSLSNHTIATTDSQTVGGVRYLFKNWSDGGSISHTVSSSKDTTFSVNFSSQYFLTMGIDSGGTINPTSNWQDSGKVVTISATPIAGFQFNSWSGSGNGSYSGVTNPVDITMNSPITETAHFGRFNSDVTVQTIPAGLTIIVDGATLTSPKTFTWVTGSSHTISTLTPQSSNVGVRYVWNSWSDAGAMTHSVTPLNAVQTFTANFTTQYYLTMVANPGGTVSPLSNWFNGGQNVLITGLPDSNHFFNLWTGAGASSYSGGNNPANVTMNGPMTETANFSRNDVQITIQSSPPGRPFIYNGVTYSTPQTRNVTPGTQQFLDAASPQPSGAGTQFIFDSWSDGGSQFHSILPDSNTTYTVYFTKQYYLTMVAGNGGTVTPATGWQDSGNVVPINAIPNVSYSFTGWKGKGPGSYSGPDNPSTVTMNGAINDTATFTQAPVHITVRSNLPGRTFIVDGVVDTTSQVYVWTSGSSHTIAIADTQSVGIDTRYLWTSWSDGGAKSHTVSPISDRTYTVNFTPQYLLSTNSSSGGTVSPSDNWFNSGQIVTIIAVPNPTFTFGGWNGTGTISYSGPKDTASVTMNGPITESASFVLIPVHVTVRAKPNGRSFIVDSVSYTSQQTFTWNYNSAHTLEASSPQAGTAGVQYIFRTWNDGGSIAHTINPVKDSTYTVDFTTQYLLTMATDTGGTATPVSSWQDSGKIVPITGIPNAGFKFSQWMGSGTGSYSGTNNPANISMLAPIMETANFALFNAQVTVRTIPAGLKIIVDDTTYTSPKTFTWLTNDNHTITAVDTQSGATATRYVWSNWNDGSTKSHSVSALRDTVFTANYTTQYYLTMNANTGGTVSPSSGWFNVGQNVILTGIPNATYSFARWSGVGNGSYDGFSNPATAIMLGPITETCSFRQNAIHVTVQTNPPGRSFIFDGTTYTTPQTFSFDPATSHALDVASPQIISAGNQYVWANWSDSGAIFHTIFPTTDTTFIVNFKLQYALTVTSTPNNTGTTIPTAISFYDSADTVQVLATPNAGFAFSGWNGDAFGSTNPLSIVMTRPKSLNANFLAGVRTTVTSNPTGRTVTVDGSTYTTPATFSWLQSSNHTIATTALQNGDSVTQFIWANWSDGAAMSHIVAPARDTTYTANFSTKYYLTMNSTSGGTTLPSNGWFLKNQVIPIRAVADSGNLFLQWTGTGAGSYTGYNDSTTITMNGPISESASFGIILPAPHLAGIPDDSTGVFTSAAFIWHSYPNAISYRLEISTNASFTQLFCDSSGITDTSTTFTNLANFKTYFWRVNASVSNNITPFSQFKKFTTIPATVSAISPSLNWGTGFIYPLRWTSTNLNGPVNLKLSTDGGATFKTIKDSVTNTGIFSWLIPDTFTVISNTCKLRIESSFNNAILGETGVFAIVSGLLPVNVSLSTTVPFSPDPYQSTEYKLISGPGIVDTIKVGSFIFGIQKTDWRMFADNGLANNYLTELTAHSTITTGNGYWLLRKGNLVIPSFTMVMPHLGPDATYSIPLHTGWNIIASPFDKTVPWRNVIEANSLTTDTLLTGYNEMYIPSTGLAPFKGYYFFNGSNLPALKIPYPFGASSSASAKVVPHLPTETNWRMQLSFESEFNHDPENYIGVASEAKMGIDRYESHKPPLFLDQGFLYFSRPDWDSQFSRFSTDIRPAIGDGQIWEFEVSNPKKSNGSIRINGLEDVPEGYQVVLMNLLNTKPFDLRKNSVYNYETVSAKMTFKILVGTKAFIDAQVSQLIPTSFELTQNYPNPFNPTTSIGVKLPKDSRIRLEVYSLLGQRVKVLADGEFTQGIHTFVWDGRDEAGHSVSSGVYLYRMLEGTNVLQSKKMIFAK